VPEGLRIVVLALFLAVAAVPPALPHGIPEAVTGNGASDHDHVRLRDVIGGLGYIVGIAGIGFYVAARRARPHAD